MTIIVVVTIIMITIIVIIFAPFLLDQQVALRLLNGGIFFCLSICLPGFLCLSVCLSVSLSQHTRTHTQIILCVEILSH